MYIILYMAKSRKKTLRSKKLSKKTLRTKRTKKTISKRRKTLRTKKNKKPTNKRKNIRRSKRNMRKMKGGVCPDDPEDCPDDYNKEFLFPDYQSPDEDDDVTKVRNFNENAERARKKYNR